MCTTKESNYSINAMKTDSKDKGKLKGTKFDKTISWTAS